MADPLLCSFCGKRSHEVKKLIAGPTSLICDECVALCNDIIVDDAKPNFDNDRRVHLSLWYNGANTYRVVERHDDAFALLHASLHPAPFVVHGDGAIKIGDYVVGRIKSPYFKVR